MLLPQEIVDRVVDEVSAERNTSQLTTCSLVSHSFHSRARTHLFSHIDLWVGLNDSYHKRASNLVRVLKYKKNSDLISRVRSLKVYMDHLLCDCQQGGWSSSAHFAGPKLLLSLIGVNTDPMVAALTMLKNAPTEKFVLKGLHEKFPNDPTERIPTLLLEMCSNPKPWVSKTYVTFHTPSLWDVTILEPLRDWYSGMSRFPMIDSKKPHARLSPP